MGKSISWQPVIGITMGDPAGIGPEIIVKALEEDIIWNTCLPFVFGDFGVMEKTIKFLNSNLKINVTESIDEIVWGGKVINILGLSNLDLKAFSFGSPNRETGKAMVGYIRKAIQFALEKKIGGIVTCPINKSALALAGYNYPGHTELLAQATGTQEYAMMLAGDRLRVVLVTTHLPFRKIPEVLASKDLFSYIRITNDFLINFLGIKEPRLAVAALNPHAGEEGIFGDEEENLIAPVIKKAQTYGINVTGPFPADTLFYFAVKGNYDAIICMYHDQGLIPLKLLHFDDAVNITLGLPIIRTSVDHGTAYDIAGKGKANPKSLINAIKLAARMALISQGKLSNLSLSG